MPRWMFPPRTEDDWADAVGAILGAPVAIRSRGPAVTDKTGRPLSPTSR